MEIYIRKNQSSNKKLVSFLYHETNNHDQFISSFSYPDLQRNPSLRLSFIDYVFSQREENCVPSGDWDKRVQEPITVTVWGVPHQMVNLACKTGLVTPDAKCFWLHEPELRLSEVVNFTRKMKYTVMMNHTTGVCSLQFTPDDHDFGEWECEFLVNNSHVQAELGSASILLMNNSPDQQLGWLVGAVTSTVLFLLILVVVVVVCKTRLCTRKIPAFLETLPSSERKRNGSNSNGIIDSGAVAAPERYAHGPPKIDLSYANPNFLSAPESIRSVLPNRSPHLYERVGRRGDTPPAKSYENAKET